MKLKLSTITTAAILAVSQVSAESIEDRINALAEELAELKAQQAAQVNNNKLSLGGYGKMDYTKSEGSDNAKLDMYRAIFYVGYQFNEDVKFVSEIEFEHGGSEDKGGYAVVEQAYIDMKLNDNVNLKVGHMIVPVGMVNVYHEPTVFTTVNRPLTEKYIIPSTWHENGITAYGKVDNIKYEAGFVAGLNAFEDSSVQTKIRDMRQKGASSEADKFGFVARVDYEGEGFNVGGSYYTGDADQRSKDITNTDQAKIEGISTTISEVHASTNIKGVKLNALYAQSEINAPSSTWTGDGKGEGYYVNAAYSMNKFTPFIQFEDLEIKKPDGTAGSQNKEATTYGINYNVTPKVVLKADYINYKSSANVTEFGIGWVF